MDWNVKVMTRVPNRLNDVTWRLMMNVMSTSVSFGSSESPPPPNKPKGMEVQMNFSVMGKEKDKNIAFAADLDTFDTLKMELERIREMIDK